MSRPSWWVRVVRSMRSHGWEILSYLVAFSLVLESSPLGIGSAPQAVVAATLAQGPAAATLAQGPVAASLAQGPFAATLAQGPVTASVVQGPVAASLAQAPVAAGLAQRPVAASLAQGPVAASLAQQPIAASLAQAAPPPPPALTLGADRSVQVGQNLSFPISASDPQGQAVSCSIDFGDGSPVSGPGACSFSHAYATVGLRAVIVTATTPDGRSTSGSLRVYVYTVASVAPHTPVTLTQLSTTFNNPIGINYHQPTNSVVISANYPVGQPHNFELISFDGTHQQFSNISGLTDEVYIATVRTSPCQQTFQVGELFTGTGSPGVIARISPDGSSIQNPWVTLPGEGGLMRGGLFIDRYCVFGGDLIVATTSGAIWRVTSAGVPTRLAGIGTLPEGPTTVPNDTTRYGPFAGRILVGAEGAGRVFSIAADGTVESFPFGGSSEAVHVIPPHENFFGVDFGSGRIVGAPADQFVDKVGDIAVAEEFGAELRSVHWNATTSTFEVSVLARVFQFEGSAFAPAGVVEVPPANQPPVATDQTVSTPSGAPLSVHLAATDPENDPLTFSVRSQPTNGTLTGTASALTYTPKGGFSGADAFTFVANDGVGDSNVATVTITVQPAPAPAPQPGAFSLQVDGSTGYAEVPPAAALNPSGDWTVELWFKDGDPAGFNHPYRYLVNKGDGVFAESPPSTRCSATTSCSSACEPAASIIRSPTRSTSSALPPRSGSTWPPRTRPPPPR